MNKKTLMSLLVTGMLALVAAPLASAGWVDDCDGDGSSDWDTDGDGVCDKKDSDIDNDGAPNKCDENPTSRSDVDWVKYKVKGCAPGKVAVIFDGPHAFETNHALGDTAAIQ